MIVITGATGNTGSKIVARLLERGEAVRAVGRSKEKIRSLWGDNVDAAVGDQGDPGFLAGAFRDADAVYLLIPPRMDTDNVRAYYNRYGETAVTALRDNNVKKVVFLSSLGAELPAGTGPVLGLHDVEEKLNRLDADVVMLRAGYFMENTLMNVPLIRDKKMNGNSIDGQAPIHLIATADIADRAAALLAERKFTGHTVLDLYGDRITFTEITRQLGLALGLENVPYVQVAAEDSIKSLVNFGVSHNMANSFVEMGNAISRGLVKPTTPGLREPNTPTRFTAFARAAVKSPAGAAHR